MKLLLTSAGITNPSIRAALLELTALPSIPRSVWLPWVVVDGVAEVVSEGNWRQFPS